MKLNDLVIDINKSLQSLPKKASIFDATGRACQLLKNIAISSKSPEYFGSFLGSCPFRYLKKISFYCGVSKTINDRFYVDKIMVSNRWFDDSVSLKIANLNELFSNLDYRKLSISSNVEDAFNFDKLKSIKF